MGWLSRVVHGWGSATIGHPTLDPGADVRATIGNSRTESRHQDIAIDTIEWSWDGHRWARWSTLSQRYDNTDLPAPESLVGFVGEDSPRPGSAFRLVDGAWRPVPARA